MLKHILLLSLLSLLAIGVQAQEATPTIQQLVEVRKGSGAGRRCVGSHACSFPDLRQPHLIHVKWPPLRGMNRAARGPARQGRLKQCA